MTRARSDPETGRRTRKPNGRSSIMLSTDGRWHGFVTMGVKSDGSLDRRHVKAKDEKTATKRVRELERQRDAGTAAKPGRVPTVATWMGLYLDTVAVNKVAPRTLEGYWSLARNWIIPHLGRHRLDRLRPEHLDALYAAMRSAGLAPSHVLKVHRVISRALKIAVRREILGRNVAQLVDPPSVEARERRPLTRTEARQVLAVADKRRNGVRWSVGLACGLRQGEALGLRWSYVNEETGDVRVWWQIQRTRWRHGCADLHACGARLHRPGCPPKCRRHTRSCPPPCPPDCARHASTCPDRHGGGLVFRPPKGKSRRTITLPAAVLPKLLAHRDAQQVERNAAGSAWLDHDLVFCQTDGTPIDPRQDWQEWKALLKAAGVRDARVHDGRHTAATLLIEQGVHVRVVQEILGHSDVRITQGYTHVASSVARDAAERMGAALWGP